MSQGKIIIVNLRMKLFESSKWVSHKKSSSGPSKRWGHTACLLGNYMYVFGGKLDQESRRFNQSFYRLNCNDYTFSRVESPGTPLLRDSHTSFVIDSCLYVWGGCINQEVSNDCHVYNQEVWSLVQQKGSVPCGRESQISVVLQNRFVMVYGGCRDEQVFRDFNIFDSKTCIWYPVRVMGEPFPALQNASLTLLNNQILFFGGLSALSPLPPSTPTENEQHNEIYFNDMYRLDLSSFKFPNQHAPPILIVNKIRYNSRAPVERANHCAIPYNNRYLIVIGGETYNKLNIDNADLLNDVWCFDIFSSEWREVKTANSHLFKKHGNFSAVLSKDEIIVFGGLRSVEDCTSSDELLSLDLIDLQGYRSNPICTLCRLIYKQATINQQTNREPSCIQQHSDLKQNRSNNRTLYKTAQMVPHPFAAILMQIKNSMLIGSTMINIQLKNLQGKSILTFTDNSYRMERKEFEFMISNTVTVKSESINDIQHYNTNRYTESIIQYSKYLKFGCFKLSKGFLVSHINGQGEAVAVMDENTLYYYFMHLVKDKGYYQLEKHAGYINDYQMVTPLMNLVGRDDPKVQKYTTRKVLYDLHCDHPNCSYVLEPTPDDILVKRSEKWRLDSQVPFQSLRAYLSGILLHQTQLKVSINNRQTIRFRSPKSIFEALGTGRIPDCNLQSQTGCQFHIFYSPERLDNQVAVYRNGWMLTKFKRNCGSDYCGYVVAPDSWQPNIFETGFDNDPEFIPDAVEYLIKHHQQGMSDKPSGENSTSDA